MKKKLWWVLGVSVVTAALSPLAFADDATDPLAELANLGSAVASNAQPQGGGSIRAKKAVDPGLMARLKDPKNLEARVDSTQTGKFPVVAVKLKVVSPAKEGPGTGVKANDSLVVIPRYKIEKGQVLMTDPDTSLNAGSFYLQEGDRVSVRLGDKKGSYWEAEYIERM